MRYFNLLILGAFICGTANSIGLAVRVGMLSLDTPSDDFITANCGTDAKFGTGIAFDIEVEQTWKSTGLGNLGTLNWNYSVEAGYWQAKATGMDNSVTFKVIPTIAYGKLRIKIHKLPLSPYLRLGFDLPYFITSWESPVDGKKSINEFGFGLDAGVGLSYILSSNIWVDLSITRMSCFITSEEYEDLGAAGSKFAFAITIVE